MEILTYITYKIIKYIYSENYKINLFLLSPLCIKTCAPCTRAPVYTCIRALEHPCTRVPAHTRVDIYRIPSSSWFLSFY